MFSNKKSQIVGRKMIFYVIFGFVAVITFFVILSFASSNRSEISIIPFGLENYLSSQRFLNSQLCFVFQDKDTVRTEPWQIDIEKFTQENLNKCYNAEDTNVKAYRLTLNYNNEKITITTKNWEGFLKKAETKKVTVYDKGKEQRAELFIEMQDAK